MTHSGRPFPSAQRIVDASNFYSDDDVRLVPNSRALVASLDLISADVGDVVAACAAVLTRYVAVADGATVAFDVTTTTGQIQRRSFVIKPDAVVSDIAEGLSARASNSRDARPEKLVSLFPLLVSNRGGSGQDQGSRGAWAVEVVTSVSGTAVYGDARQVDLDSVRAFAHHVEAMLAAAVSDPLAVVADVDLLSDTERDFLLRQVNVTCQDLPSQGTIFAEFASRASRQPNDVLCIQGDASYTFRDMLDMTGVLASRLQSHGVQRGDGIAIRMDRTPRALAAILAVLRVGAYYVPLGKNLPHSEVLRITEVAGPRLVCVDEAFALGDLLVIDVEAALDGSDDGTQPVTADQDTGQPLSEDLCYVLFSSGSTGAPKGIRLRNRGVLNNLLDLKTRFAIGPGDAVLSVSNLSFDMSVFELIGSALSGATIIFPDGDLANNPRHWQELMVEHSVTIWNSAPALLTLLLAEPEAGAAAAQVRLVLCGGDWMPPELPAQLWRVAPGCRVINLGGATEVSIHSTIHEVTAVDVERASIPYGAPMANQRIYVLGTNDRPVPVGVPGDLLIAGIGVGAGYVGVDESASARFQPWSYENIVEEQAYRTGDIVRMMPGGELQLLGRSDFQVKINGVRLDTRNVEDSIRALSRVAECLVVSGSIGERAQLQALIVTHDGNDIDLRSALQDAVPSWAVPSSCLVVESLPRSTNGKIDRRAASAMFLDSTGSQAGLLDDQARLVAEAWGAALSLDGSVLGEDDDFFALGGDSFAAMRVVQLLNNRIDLGDVFAASRLGDLGKRLAEEVAR